MQGVVRACVRQTTAFVVCAVALAMASAGCAPLDEPTADRPRAKSPAAKPTPTPSREAPSPTSDLSKTPTRTHTPKAGEARGGSGGVPARAVGPYAVVRVVDGDTIEVSRRGGTTLRLIGIDTPETVHPSEPVECYGPAASRRAHGMLDGRRVYLELDPSQGRLDAYGRTLAYVWLAGAAVSFNERMVRAGYANEYTYDTPYRYQARFIRAERRARAAGRGLWGACRGNGAAPAPPAGGTDPRFGTCGEANDAGYGPYQRGRDPEYDWYDDADGDGLVCET